MDSRINRRGWLGLAFTLGAASEARAAGAGIALGDRAHFLAQPVYRDALTRCLTEIVGCAAPVVLPSHDPAGPILAFSFPGGGSVSVQFTAEAPDEAQARRGAWLELRGPDPAALQAAVLAAGLPRVRYAATNTFYFAAPGGQVFAIPRAGRPELKP